MNKSVLCLLGSYLLLVSTIVVLSRKLYSANEYISVLRNNTGALMGNAEKSYTNNGLLMSKVNMLTLELDTYKKYREQDVKLLQDARVTIKRLQSVTNIGYFTKDSITTKIIEVLTPRDSIIFDTLRCIDYKSEWIDVSGCFDSENFNGTILSRDSLLVSTEIVPKQWWFIKWGVKTLKQTVISKRPNTSELDIEYIVIRN